MAEPSASSFTGEVTSRLPDLTSLDAVELLQVHGAAIEELKRRGIVTTDNAPLGDYAEHLVCKCGSRIFESADYVEGILPPGHDLSP